MDREHREYIRNYQRDLARYIEVQVNEVARSLYTRGIISEEMRNEILSEHTPRGRTYCLLERVLPVCSSNAYDAFHDVCVELELRPAVDILSQKYTGGKSDCTDAKDEFQKGRTQKGHGASSGGPSEPLTKLSFDANRYKMNIKKRGVAMIFNNKTFDDKLLPERVGTDVDRDNMISLLSNMGFRNIKTFNNATAKKMKDEIDTVAEEDHSERDCFVCVILSHGGPGFVYGKDKKVAIDDLVRPLKGDRCTSLVGKPKIFFIQACRGEKYDKGASNKTDGRLEAETVEEEVVERIIPVEADFLMAYSTVAGYVSWRNPGLGSWFIQAIYSVFTALWESVDLLSMMTEVNKMVAYEFQSLSSTQEGISLKKQCPYIASQLTKRVHFNM